MPKEFTPQKIDEICAGILKRIAFLRRNAPVETRFIQWRDSAEGAKRIQSIEKLTEGDPKRAKFDELVKRTVNFSNVRAFSEEYIHVGMKVLILEAIQRGWPEAMSAIKYVQSTTFDIDEWLIHSDKPLEIEPLKDVAAFAMYIQLSNRPHLRELVDQTKNYVPVAPVVPLSRKHEKIMDVVGKSSFALTNIDIAERADLSRRTVDPAVKDLLNAGRLVRPAGPRSGVTIAA